MDSNEKMHPIYWESVFICLYCPTFSSNRSNDQMIYFPMYLWYLWRGPRAVDCTAAVGRQGRFLYWTNHDCIGQVTCGAEKCPAAAVNQAAEMWSSSSGDRHGCHTAAYWFSHWHPHMWVFVCVSPSVYVCVVSVWGPIQADKAPYLKSREHWVYIHTGLWRKRRMEGRV